MSSQTIHKEFNIKYFAGKIVASNLRKASEEEVEEARLKYAVKGECDHSLVIDEDCWIYNVRSCAICKTGLGTT